MEDKKKVKYSNVLNNLILKDFTAIDIDVFMLICQRMRDKGTQRLVLTFTELKKILGLSRQRNEYFQSELERIDEKLETVKYYHKDEKKRKRLILFPTFFSTIEDTYDEDLGHIEANTLVITVNPDCVNLLNELTDNYTAFDLKELISLETKYSKQLFRLLKQWRREGKYKVNSIDMFKSIMDCPKSYTAKYIMDKIIKPSINELSAKNIFKNLTVETIRDESKRGRPIVGYTFTFDKEEANNNQQVKATKVKPNPNNRFNNFEGRNYSSTDYADMERMFANNN